MKVVRIRKLDFYLTKMDVSIFCFRLHFEVKWLSSFTHSKCILIERLSARDINILADAPVRAFVQLSLQYLDNPRAVRCAWFRFFVAFKPPLDLVVVELLAMVFIFCHAELLTYPFCVSSLIIYIVCLSRGVFVVPSSNWFENMTPNPHLGIKGKTS